MSDFSADILFYFYIEFFTKATLMSNFLDDIGKVHY